MNKNKSKQTNKSKTQSSSQKTKRALMIFVCIFVGIVLAFGATLGIINGVKRAKSLVYFRGVGIDSGAAAYLVSYYKGQYMASLARGGISVSDTPEFWGMSADGKMTYGDYLAASTETYLRQLVAANKIFDEYTSLSAEDNKKIETAIEEVLAYRAGGQEKSFNEKAEKYGFDFDDFSRATRMIFKGWAAKTKIFGDDGAGMAKFPEFLEEYYAAYHHVDLIFVRTETKFVLDENGNRVDDGEGNDKQESLTDEEKAEKAEIIEEIRRAVSGINSGEVAPERFFELQTKYDDGDKSSHSKGYYFYSQADYTIEFATQFESLVNTVYDMRVGEAREVDTKIGKCFIYKTERAANAYNDNSETWCFSDFYEITADAMYQKMIEEYAEATDISEKLYELDFINIPYNTEFIARF